LSPKKAIAVVSADLVVEPAMEDDPILRAALLKAVVTDRRAGWQIRARCVLVVVHVLRFPLIPS
jgi:hypothetical protein